MSGLRRSIGLAFGVWALSGLGMAHAQENLDAGKTAAQLYASDCAICHKSPHGLSNKVGGILGLQSFLQEHYTASRESAARLAAYLKSTDTGPTPASHRGKTHPAASAHSSNKAPHEHAAPKKKSDQKKESKAS